MMPLSADPVTFLAIALALFLGGVVKGATGAGAPVIAVPVIAAFADVRLAVLVMVVPNVASNLWQGARYRHALPPGPMPRLFAAGGAVGAVGGTFLLLTVDERALMGAVAVAVLAYVALRAAVPAFRLSPRLVLRLSPWAGLAGGALQGAAGVSAPVSVSFLNAARLERAAFVATISVYFTVMTAVQMGAQIVAGLLTGQVLMLSVAACAPLALGMFTGGHLARHMSAVVFDRAVLAMLSILALRLGWAALS